MATLETLTTMTTLDIRDDDDFMIAVVDPNWAFGMAPRDDDDADDDDFNHPFAIVGSLLDWAEHIPEAEMTDEQREFPIMVESSIVPVALCESGRESVKSCYGTPLTEINPEYVLDYTIEMTQGYGFGVPCTRDVLGARLSGTDPFEGLTEGQDYVLSADDPGNLYFKEWDVACKWLRVHLPNVAPCIGGLIGFTLDRPVNRIGTSGWDWLRPAVTGEAAW